MMFGGEACTPILEWDGIQITEKPGPLALKLQAYLKTFSEDSDAQD